MEFKEGHVAMISQVKFFMGNIVDKNVFVNMTKFQGSQDGENYDDIFVIDENIHEGWNYHKWELPEEYPKYRFYRFAAA
jgi:pantothenate synthetase